MCSRRWETPVMPVCSLREPTRYQTLKLTTGAPWTSLVRTRRPFGRTVSVIPAVRAGPGRPAGAWAAAVVTAATRRSRTANVRERGYVIMASSIRSEADNPGHAHGPLDDEHAEDDDEDLEDRGRRDDGVGGPDELREY